MEDGLASVAILMNFGCLQHRPSELRDEDSEGETGRQRDSARQAIGRREQPPGRMASKVSLPMEVAATVERALTAWTLRLFLSLAVQEDDNDDAMQVCVREEMQYLVTCKIVLSGQSHGQ